MHIKNLMLVEPDAYVCCCLASRRASRHCTSLLSQSVTMASSKSFAAVDVDADVMTRIFA